MKNIKNKILILIILISGCVNKKNILNIKKQTNWNYSIGIEGIECKLCAYKAVKRLEKIPDIFNVKIICSPNYRECHANLDYYPVHGECLRSKCIEPNINIHAIIKAIEQEGFEVKYISGNLIGMFDDKLDKFNLLGQDINAKFMTTISNPNLLTNKKITVDAKLVFQHKLHDIWMILN